MVYEDLESFKSSRKSGIDPEIGTLAQKFHKIWDPGEILSHLAFGIFKICQADQKLATNVPNNCHNSLRVACIKTTMNSYWDPNPRFAKNYFPHSSEQTLLLQPSIHYPF